MTYSMIAGSGSYLPERVMHNKEFEELVDTSDEWIRERTGIKRRHIAAEGEKTSDMAIKAGRQAIAAANMDASDLGLIIVATTTPDKVFPSTACIVQRRLELQTVPAFDIHAACSGFIYALVAHSRCSTMETQKRRSRCLWCGHRRSETGHRSAQNRSAGRDDGQQHRSSWVFARRSI